MTFQHTTPPPAFLALPILASLQGTLWGLETDLGLDQYCSVSCIFNVVWNCCSEHFIEEHPQGTSRDYYFLFLVQILCHLCRWQCCYCCCRCVYRSIKYFWAKQLLTHLLWICYVVESKVSFLYWCLKVPFPIYIVPFIVTKKIQEKHSIRGTFHSVKVTVAPAEHIAGCFDLSKNIFTLGTLLVYIC